MSLLVSGVFRDKVEIFSADDEGAMHFRRYDFAGKDSSSDRDHAGEGTLLVWTVQ